MLFGKLLPREGNFEMFNQHADRIVEAAQAFSLPGDELCGSGRAKYKPGSG